METIAVNEETEDSVKNKIDSHIGNYSDDELIFKELCIKYNSLKSENKRMLQVRKDLLVLNKKYESICKSLLKTKTDYELYKSDLHKTLYNLKISTDKQKILSRKKLDELYNKQSQFEEYYKVSPHKLELDELTKFNESLEQDWINKIHLFKLTKKQYCEIESLIIETFKKKVCEFCDVVLKLKALNK